MTKRDFIALADHFRTHHPYNGTEQMQVQAMAEFLQVHCPNFDYARWIAYVNPAKD